MMAEALPERKLKPKATGQSSFGYHRLATFIKCPQKYAYRYEANLVLQFERAATGVGTLVHEALRSHYMRENPFEVLDAMPKRYGPYIDRAKKIFEAYKKHYFAEKLNVLSAEDEFEVTIAGNKFTRRLDLVIEKRGFVYVVDHKTAAQPKDRAATAELDWSLSTQALVGRALLPAKYQMPWGGVILNVIPTNDKMIGFMRKTLLFPERVLEKIPMSLAYYYEQINSLKNTNIYQYPRSGACQGRYGPCDYLHLCNGGQQYLNMFITDRPN